MKTTRIYTLLFFLLLAPLAPQPVLLFAQTGPKFEAIEGDNINTGNHLRGKEVQYEIKFKNSGDADLKIEGVSTSCGCSSALVSSDLLKPGEEGIIKFTFNGHGMGQVQKSVMVSTNENPGTTHTIAVVMNMVDPVTLTPASIITEGNVGDEINQTATILNSFDKSITINEISSNSPVVKVSSDRNEINQGEAASISISIKLYEESPVNAAVFIKTTEGEFQIPIFVDVK
jgi:hypothetical protein